MSMEVVDELSVMTYVSMLYKRMTKQSRSGKCCVYTSHQIHIYMVSSLEAGGIFKRPGIRRHSKNGRANKVLLLVFSFFFLRLSHEKELQVLERI